MTTNKTNKTDSSDLTDSAASAATSAIDANTHGGTNVQQVQNMLLVWLDGNIDENKNECQNAIAQLRRIVNDANLFNNCTECIKFIQSINNNKVCVIIPGFDGRHIVPQVHDMPQVQSIFIYCGNKKRHEQWSKKWPKIKGIFTDFDLVCKALQKASKQCEQDALSISCVATGPGILDRSLNQLDPTFMYTEIMKKMFFTIPFDLHDRKTFIEYCRVQFAGNTEKLKTVNDFDRAYEDETPIWWYTSDSFLYPMLNTALRTMDGEIMVKMGFFINDLHHQLQELYVQQRTTYCPDETFTLYRGQGLSETSFEQLQKTKGGLMSFNNFLSTSKQKSVSMKFVIDALANPDSVGVLFVMTIDPAKSTTPFASVNEVGYYKDEEDEVLFSMHSVFRINDIQPMTEYSRLFQITLTLTSDNDEDLHKLTARIEEDTYPEEAGWFRVGCVLLKMGQPKTAEEVFQGLLKQPSEESKKGNIYRSFGLAKYDQGQYEEALKLYMKSIEIDQNTLPTNHPDLGITYNRIGNVYYSMADYPKALFTHHIALKIRQESLPPNHPDLATTYNNIGGVYYSAGDYAKALLYYKKALDIRQKSLPSNHPDLAMTYSNIGAVYDSVSDYPRALLFHEKALQIKQQSLASNHPDLAASYNNIGLVYKSMSDYPKALSSLDKALAIKQQSLPLNHPSLAVSHSNIGLVYHSMNDYPKALSHYEKAFAIDRKTLSHNHPDLASSYNNIGNVYGSMGEYPKALSYYEKALAIWQQSLPPNHPSLAASYYNIGGLYYNMVDYPKALSSHEKALEIREQSLPPNHPDLAMSHNNIGLVYKNMGDDEKAQFNYEQAVTIAKQSVTPNHSIIQKYERNLDDLEKKS